jgi:hypothetical protein
VLVEEVSELSQVHSQTSISISYLAELLVIGIVLRDGEAEVVVDVGDEEGEHGHGIVASLLVLTTVESQEEVLSVGIGDALEIDSVLLCFVHRLGQLLVEVFSLELLHGETGLILLLGESALLVHQGLEDNMLLFVSGFGDVVKDILD